MSAVEIVETVEQGMEPDIKAEPEEVEKKEFIYPMFTEEVAKIHQIRELWLKQQQTLTIFYAWVTQFHTEFVKGAQKAKFRIPADIDTYILEEVIETEKPKIISTKRLKFEIEKVREGYIWFDQLVIGFE